MLDVEKLFVKLHKRNRSILEQVRQRTESYCQHLASKLLIAGFNPPSWALDPDSASGAEELNKEDLISKLLRPHPHPSASCSVAHYPGYGKLVFNGENEEFSDGEFVENTAFNKNLESKNDPTAPEHGECELNMVPEIDASVASPDDHADESTSPDHFLSRIQRSKSRQKALELRSSAKAQAKSGLRHESTSDVVSSQIRFSLSNTYQPCQNDELSQLAETGVENYKENASSQDARARRTGSIPIPDSKHADNHVNKSPKSAGPSAKSCEIFRDTRVEDADFLCKDEEKNVYTGEITRLGMPYSVSLACSGERYGWNSRNRPSSPVGKLWDQLSSHSGSSEKKLSSNPEFTCFPIEEDPSSSEDNKTMEDDAGDTQDEIDSSLANHCNKRQLLEDLTNMGKTSSTSVSAVEEILRADSVDYMSSKFSVTGTEDKALLDPNQTRKHQLSSFMKAKESVNNNTCKSVKNSIHKPVVSNKTSLKGQDQKLSLRESRRNNIVSNISSFIPLIKQKQAAPSCTGKRDVKVKALEAAEAAKRLEEKKESERKMRKEALKLERAKMEEKKLRHMELEKKRKEEERKKKDAAIIAKKRLREEEERKEKRKKRMRLEARQQQREQEEKKRAERPEKENQRTKDDQMNNKKEFNNESKRQQNRQTTGGEGPSLLKTQINLTLNEVVMNNEECGTSGLSCEAGEVMHVVDKSPRKEDLLVQNSLGNSYEISPYQCSDDEDEKDDQLRTKKYVPSWARKSSVALVLPLQLELDPDVVFPPDSRCSVDEVLLPRKLQQKQVAA